jgi:Zn-dependent alcohol dehydrogenase
VELLGAGQLVPDALVTHEKGLEAVPEALALMAAGQALKVAIDPRR